MSGFNSQMGEGGGGGGGHSVRKGISKATESRVQRGMDGVNGPSRDSRQDYDDEDDYADEQSSFEPTSRVRGQCTPARAARRSCCRIDLARALPFC